MELTIAIEHAGAPVVQSIVRRHLAFSRSVTPPEHVRTLDVDAMLETTVTVFGARIDGELVGIGALRELDAAHGELKAMHTSEAARRRGVGRAMVEHLVAVATARGYRRVSLETGTAEAFAPARTLYRAFGFTPCEPFGTHVPSPYSTFMTLELPAMRGGDGSDRS